MKTLILSSSFTIYYKDENGNKIPTVIDNDNGFLDNLKKHLNNRKCMVIISGNPNKTRENDPTEVIRKSFKMSDIAFEEYIYVDSTNKHKIKEYISKATTIDLCGGHLPTCNAFINELNLKELLKDYNGVILGSSGGAMNMAKNVYCIPEVEGEHTDINFKRILKGLALTDLNVIPHYQYFKTFKFGDGIRMLEDILLPDSKLCNMIALPDRSYIIQQGNNIEFYGEIYTIKNNKINSI